MLAVQRPMGSSKPPNPDRPFGYSFDDNPSFPFPSPTAPAPGPSLLDDNESKFLDNFFDGVSGDNFNYDFFSTQAPDGSELGLGWEELPPAFMGTTSSFGQQPQIAPRGMANPNFADIPPHMSNSGPHIPPPASEDVLAAATLLQNGSAHRAQSISNEAMFSSNQQNHLQSPSGQMRAQSVSQYTPARSSTMQERAPGTDNMYFDMLFGNPNQQQRPKVGNIRADLKWGSDSGFGSPQGFVPPQNQAKAAATEQYQITVEGALKLEPNSTGTTRPSSPILTHSRKKSIGRPKVDDDPESRPRKRRKSKYQDEVEEDDESPASKADKSGKKRKTPKKASSNDSPTSPSEQLPSRRKSTAAANAAAKTARENLTEDQKRENHIKSEQKRRTLIREGFEDLGELVPGLRGGGFSKSAVLIMSADWLEDLIQGNEILKKRLDALHG